jgi:hypothetical protein
LRRPALTEPPGSLEAKLTEELFGGKIRVERDKEYLETPDGRRIPFSALSSGQQELLPLLVILGWVRPGRTQKDSDRRLIYIEEPEAHLFPSAQSILIAGLAGLVGSSRDKIDMILTTHSPYVLAKINNLIKAGTLGKRETIANRVNSVVPKRAWLQPGSVSGYAIVDRKLCSIVDDDGLLNADYLDDVSGDIAREFSTLLEIEVSNGPK